MRLGRHHRGHLSLRTAASYQWFMQTDAKYSNINLKKCKGIMSDCVDNTVFDIELFHSEDGNLVPAIQYLPSRLTNAGEARRMPGHVTDPATLVIGRDATRADIVFDINGISDAHVSVAVTGKGQELL